MPTREQLIQQANLRADWEEAKERGEGWTLECRPWRRVANDAWWFTNSFWLPDFEYRRQQKPLEVWLVVDDNDDLYRPGDEPPFIFFSREDAEKHAMGDYRVIHLSEVQE